MLTKPRVAALATGLVVACSLAATAQQGGAKKAASSGSVETVLVSGYVDWLMKSDVAALREGVIDKMEMKVGTTVAEGKTIGFLHKETAVLTQAKAQVAAESKGAIEKGKAQFALAKADLARLVNLNKRGLGFVSDAEIQKGEAEVKVGAAMTLEAEENQKLAQAEFDIAKQVVKEHTIVAPFAGLIIEQLKFTGESVRANEPVVRMGKIDTLKFFGDVPYAASGQLAVGQIVDITPDIDGVDLPIERKAFRGKIYNISREIVSVNKTVVTVFAEVRNNNSFELLPGLKARMVVYLTKDPKMVPAPHPESLPPEPEDGGQAAPAREVGLAPRAN